ncbi:hypothetical protein MMC17_002763 [Xylographa soralifera]|nr:hypothetical protein [Xylographa soralifera]
MAESSASTRILEEQPPEAAPKKSKRSMSPSVYNKPCTICQTPRDVLVRCRIDESEIWHFVCPGKCWRNVSGGQIDGLDRPYYQYGGMWKNKHAGVSAKKPKGQSRKVIAGSSIRPWSPLQVRYTKNDKVHYENLVWSCRQTHESGEKSAPNIAYRYWKEHPGSSSTVVVDVDEVGDDYETFPG